MTRKLLAIAFSAALAPQLAAAADMPVKAPPLEPVSVASWAGFYIGGQVGGAWTRESLHETTALVPPLTGNASVRDRGIVGGGHLGYNWQNGRFVIGAEGDIEGTSLSQTSNCLIQDAGVGNPAPGSCFGGTYSFGTDLKWQASIRGRLGYTWANSLLYVTGGLAVARVETTFSNAGLTQSFNHTKTGPTVGAGAEFMFRQNWSGRVEYRFAEFKDIDSPNTNAGAFWNGYTGHQTIREHSVRVGISYHFNAPLVARY